MTDNSLASSLITRREPRYTLGASFSLLCAVAATVSCTVEAAQDDEPVASVRQAIGGGWRKAIPVEGLDGSGFVGGPGTISGGGAVCDAYNATGGWALIGRESGSNRMMWYIQEDNYQHPWAYLGGSNATFSSKPACTALDAYGTNFSLRNFQKAILARRSTNNRYYIRLMKIPPGEPGPNNFPLPSETSTVLSWTSISSDTWSSAPAATVVEGNLVVCGRRSRDIWCQYKFLNLADTDDPYGTGNSWTPAAQAPPLPDSGWRIKGDPAIVYNPATSSVAIVTRATNQTQTRIYGISWYGNGYSNWFSFSNISVPISSDPALSLDQIHDMGITLFFSSGGSIYEGSGSQGYQFTRINASDGTSQNNNSGWILSPAAVGNLVGQEGEHVVITSRAEQTRSEFSFMQPCTNFTCSG